MDVAVDLIVFAWDNPEWKLLLIERANPPFQGHWALPGGFVDEGEGLSDAARRELVEETGVQLKHMIQVGAFGHPDRDPRKRVISVTYVAVLHERFESIAGDDAAKAQWFSMDALPALAFDHDALLRCGLERMQNHYRLKKHLPASGPLPQMAVHTFMGIVLQ